MTSLVLVTINHLLAKHWPSTRPHWLHRIVLYHLYINQADAGGDL